jgi:hypothetical protein
MTRKERMKKVTVMVAAVVLLLMGTVGIKAMQYHSHSKEVAFSVAGYSFELLNDLVKQDSYAAGDVVSHSVAVKNTGSGGLYVRIKAVFESSDVENVCSIDLNTTDYVYSDGYYYLVNPLTAGKTSPALFTTITIASDAVLADGFRPNIIVYAEVVQRGSYNNYADAWAATLS